MGSTGPKIWENLHESNAYSLFALLPLLAACETAYPDIALDAAAGAAGKNCELSTTSRSPQKSSKQQQPYPLPGQLKPVEEAPANPSLKPHQRIDTPQTNAPRSNRTSTGF